MIKKFLEFVNEGKNNKLNESQEIYKIGKVNVQIDYDIASSMAGEENNDEIKKYLKDFIDDFNLVSGSFYLDDNELEIRGKLKSGKSISVDQHGSWAGEFGGSTAGKSHHEEFEIDGKDVLPSIKKAIEKAAGGSVKFYPLWRADMFGDLCK